MKKLAVIILIVILFSWSKIANAQETIPSNNKNSIITANTDFGFKLFHEVLTEKKDNVFISPLSISLALSMTYNGAELETKKAFENTLQLSGLNSEEINNQVKVLKSDLEKKEKEANPISLKIANSLWVEKNFQLKEDFLQKTKDYFQAKVSNLDFSNPDSKNTINSWVSDNTNNKIKTIIEQLSPLDKLILINAIYFKAKWAKEFNKDQTMLLPFHKSSGETVDVQMMSQNGDYRYLETANFQAISLSYSDKLTSLTEVALPDNGATSLYVFLPSISSNLKEFYQNLNANNWRQWLKQFSSKPGQIKLPRFKMEYSIDLNQSLNKLGLGLAFSNDANFSAISTAPLKIGKVIHKTFVDLNEEGTEAAAVTAVIMKRLAIVEEIEPFKMIVDRPFFCAIVDNNTESILFMGSIENPK